MTRRKAPDQAALAFQVPVSSDRLSAIREQD